MHTIRNQDGDGENQWSGPKVGGALELSPSYDCRYLTRVSNFYFAGMRVTYFVAKWYLNLEHRTISDGKSQTLVIRTSVGLQHFIYCPQYDVLIDMNRRLLKRNITVSSISTHSVLGILSKKLFDQRSSNAPFSWLPESDYIEAARQVPVDSQHAGMQPVNISLTP